MQKERVVAIAGFLILLALFGYSYYVNQSAVPALPEKEAALDNRSQLNTAETIEQAQNNGESMWLLFRSATCAPCIEMQKVFDQLESDYTGKVRFIAIDVDDRNNIELVKKWKIQYIPASFIVDGAGKLSYQNVGIIPTEDLQKELNKVVK